MAAAGREALVFLFSVGTFALARPSAAQDANYWSQQYGTRSELLGGAVVGSPEDLSTTFYNPGGLAFLEQSFLLSAAALQYQRLSLEEPSGRLTDLESRRFGTAPSLVTGTFPRDWVEGTLAYTLLTRQRLEFRIDDWQGEVRELGPEPVTVNVLIDGRADDGWGGLTWSRPVGDVGIGVTLFAARRSQRARTEWLSQPVPTGSEGLAVASVDDYSYWHFRLLAKIGAYWKLDGTGLGVTITTRGLPLFGGGRAAFYRSVVPADPSDSTASITEAGVDDDPKVTYRSPLSIAIGSRHRVGKNAIYATLEWFDSVARYRVLETSVAPDSGPGAGLASALTNELSAVLNFAVGYEYSPRDNLTVFGSFLTDFSAAVSDPSVSHSFSTWDIYQVTGGAAFRAARVDLTLGLSYATGSEPLVRQNDLISPLVDSIKVRYRRVKAFIGFEFRS